MNVASHHLGVTTRSTVMESCHSCSALIPRIDVHSAALQARLHKRRLPSLGELGKPRFLRHGSGREEVHAGTHLLVFLHAGPVHVNLMAS